MYCWNFAVEEALTGDQDQATRNDRLTNGRLRLWNLSKLNNTTSLGSSPIEKNFSEFNLPSSFE